MIMMMYIMMHIVLQKIDQAACTHNVMHQITPPGHPYLLLYHGLTQETYLQFQASYLATAIVKLNGKTASETQRSVAIVKQSARIYQVPEELSHR
jgi:hypothetical protein